MDTDGPKEELLDAAQISYAKGQFLGERTYQGVSDDTIVSCAETAGQIEMPFGLWTRVGPRSMY